MMKIGLIRHSDCCYEGARCSCWLLIDSNAYYLNPHLNKRTWAIIFGAASLTVDLLPTLHNFRIFSFVGALTTTYTSWYMLTAAISRGQVAGILSLLGKHMRVSHAVMLLRCPFSRNGYQFCTFWNFWKISASNLTVISVVDNLIWQSGKRQFFQNLELLFEFWFPTDKCVLVQMNPTLLKVSYLVI